MANTIRLLHVEDDGQFAELVETFLHRELADVTIQHAVNPAEGAEILAESPIDCIVSDYDMPEINGIEFLEAVRDDYPELPFILFTGKGSEEVASEAISKGVTDYLQKGSGTDQYALLANRVKNAVERTKADQRAEEAQARYQTLIDDVLETSDIGTFILDANFEIVWINSAVEKYFGITRDDVIEADKRELIESEIADKFEDPERFKNRVTATYDDNTYVEEFSCHILPGEDRRERWLKHWSQPIESGLFQGGRIEHYTDITERKARKQELRRTERRFEAVLEDPNILAGVLDTDGRLLEANQTAMKYVDADIEDVLGEFFWETPWWSEDLQPAVRDHVEQAAQGQYVSYEADLETPDDEPYSVEGVIRPVTDDSGTVVSLIVSARDITDRAVRQQRLETILENTENPLFMKDREGRYLLVNEGYKRVFGLEETEVIGRTDAEIFPPEMADEVWANDRQVLETGETVEKEERIMVNGEARTYLSTKTPVYDIGTESDPEEPVAVFGVAQDITE